MTSYLPLKTYNAITRLYREDNLPHLVKVLVVPGHTVLSASSMRDGKASLLQQSLILLSYFSSFVNRI